MKDSRQRHAVNNSGYLRKKKLFPLRTHNVRAINNESRARVTFVT